ncbi:MAG TPA: TMEM175 family protein [Trichocoleus sp.]
MKHDRLGLERIVFFTDAVFAIALALLALDIHLPDLLENPAPDHPLDLLSHHQGYVTSLFMVGLYWVSHRHCCRFIRRYNKTFVAINLALLLNVALLPFATTVFEDYGQHASVVIFYALCMAVTGYLKTGLWLYATHHHRLISRYLTCDRIRRLTWRVLIPPLVFTASAGIAFFDITLARLAWGAVLFALWPQPVIRLALLGQSRPL